MIPNQLLKYGGLALAEHMAGDLNAIFDRGKMISTIGQGGLIPLQKPGKPKGEFKSQHPVVPLNSIHMVFHLIVLGRIHEQVDRYLPTSQSAFHKGRSLSEIIFANCVLSHVVQDKVAELHILGIDLLYAWYS